MCQPGYPTPQRRIPFQLLLVELRLGEPQHEIGFVALVVVFFDAVAYTVLQIVFFEVVENVVLL